jgi:putative phosphoesterase
MKKVVVMSDNHGQGAMIDKVKSWEYDADEFVHCGDSEADNQALQGWKAVKGNNDWMSTLPEEEVFEVEGIRFYLCHGHRLPFYNRDEYIIDLLQRTNSQIFLCGHSHVPEHRCIEGYHIINPGSTTLPRGGSEKGYCVILLEDGNVRVEFKQIL